MVCRVSLEMSKFKVVFCLFVFKSTQINRAEQKYALFINLTEQNPLRK